MPTYESHTRNATVGPEQFIVNSDGSRSQVIATEVSVSSIDQLSPTDRSGTITSGGVAQSLMAANANRKYLLIQNNGTSGNLWFNFTVTAVQSQPSILLQPGQAFTMENRVVFVDAISIIGATTGQIFSAKEA